MTYHPVDSLTQYTPMYGAWTLACRIECARKGANDAATCFLLELMAMEARA